MNEKTLRDEIAIAAMAAFVAENSPIENEDILEAIAGDAYRMADIMLRVREGAA